MPILTKLISSMVFSELDSIVQAGKIFLFPRAEKMSALGSKLLAAAGWQE
jgi:hypothetical protein